MSLPASRLHRYLDVALVAMLLVTPVAFRLPIAPLAVSWVAAVLILALGAMTRFRFGIASALDIGGHHAFEMAIALALGFGGALCGSPALRSSRVVLVIEALVVGGVAMYGLTIRRTHVSRAG